MRKIVACAALALCAVCGCRTQKQEIIVVENGQVVTNQAPLQAFSRENFVWESWFFSTNKVEKTK